MEQSLGKCLWIRNVLLASMFSVSVSLFIPIVVISVRCLPFSDSWFVGCELDL